MPRTILKQRPARVLHPALEGLDERIMPSAGVAAPHHVVHVAVHHVAKPVVHHPVAKQAKAHVAATKAAQIATAAHRNAILASQHAKTAALVATPVVAITPATTTAVPVATPALTTDSASISTSTVPTSATITTNAYPGNPTPVATPVATTPNNPIPKANDVLNEVYREYQSYLSSGGAPSSFTTSEASRIYIQGNLVGANISVVGDLATYEAQLTALGFQVTAVSTSTHSITGYLPIDQIPTVAQITETIGIAPIYKPILR
jgi:hypothetical protein